MAEILRKNIQYKMKKQDAQMVLDWYNGVDTDLTEEVCMLLPEYIIYDRNNTDQMRFWIYIYKQSLIDDANGD